MNEFVRWRNHYHISGLNIASSIPFPELSTACIADREFAPDIEFELGGDLSLWLGGDIVMTWEDSVNTKWLICTKTDHGYRLHFPELADFLVERAGRQVRCVASAEATPATLRHLFLDQVIPLVLNLHGREALHASAVHTSAGACAFMGMAGSGKSTLAAAFQAAGHRVLSDDCLGLRENADPVAVEPAYPGLRLWNDSREAFFSDDAPTQLVSQFNSKRRVARPGAWAIRGETYPLRAIYTLRGRQQHGSSMGIVLEPLSVRDAFMELFEFAFRLDLTDRAMLLRQMRVLEKVAKGVAVKRLHLPDSFDALNGARDVILRDIQRK